MEKDAYIKAGETQTEGDDGSNGESRRPNRMHMLGDIAVRSEEANASSCRATTSKVIATETARSGKARAGRGGCGCISHVSSLGLPPHLPSPHSASSMPISATAPAGVSACPPPAGVSARPPSDGVPAVRRSL